MDKVQRYYPRALTALGKKPPSAKELAKRLARPKDFFLAFRAIKRRMGIAIGAMLIIGSGLGLSTSASQRAMMTNLARPGSYVYVCGRSECGGVLYRVFGVGCVCVY